MIPGGPKKCNGSMDTIFHCQREPDVSVSQRENLIDQLLDIA
jgi:hypothetical protein